ncbi:MAG: transglutaminase domain-containing protein [Candidatus Hydrogenedentes bacterium]|nr:transglutaminase domain-containing protein [Candidatus Hydrogenedentota bacterium]
MICVRVLAFLLLLIPAGTLAIVSQQYMFPAIVATFGMVGVWGRFQQDLERSRRIWLFGGIAMVFAAKWLVTPPLLLGGSSLPLFPIGFIDYVFGYYVAQYLIFCQAANLFLKNTKGPPRFVPISAAMAMVMVGTLPVSQFGTSRGAAFQTASLLLAVVTGLYFSAVGLNRMPQKLPARVPQRGRFLIVGGVLLVVVVFGWVVGQGIYRYGERVDQVIGILAAPPDSAGTFGFPTIGRFGTIDQTKVRGGNATALRIFSESAPGYLRGRIYDTYEPPMWLHSASTEFHGPVAVRGLPAASLGAQWFTLHETTTAMETAKQTMEVHPVAELNHTVFAPMVAAYLSLPVPRLEVDAHGVPQFETLLGPATSYQLAGIATPETALGNELRIGLVALPDNLDPRVKELAQQLTEGCRTDQEKAAAIERYLIQNYEYNLSAGPARAPDPVSAFLFDVRKGQCEFFAAAAAILLRSVNIPSRYVNGFVAYERNPFGGYWFARNRDAHAWVEAYLEGRGWTLVEATPGSGVPSGQASQWAQLWDYVKYLPRAALELFKTQGISAVATWITGRLWKGVIYIGTSLPGLLVISIVALFATHRILRHLRRSPKASDLHFAPLRRLLAKLDHHLAKQGLVRAGSETLHHFAGRIEVEGHSDEAAWYRTYAKARYDPEHNVTDLRKTMPLPAHRRKG